MSFQNSPSEDLQPRYQRKRVRRTEERGLAPDDELANLARAYLQTQHELWPELVKNGQLPPQSDEAIQRMVTQYKECHQSQRLDLTTVRTWLNTLRMKLAAAYARYRCHNSSPTSILDQMVNCLHKAHKESRFIPWQFVFTDYSVSGLDAGRRGYLNRKALAKESTKPIDTVYIDDFSRATGRNTELTARKSSSGGPTENPSPRSPSNWVSARPSFDAPGIMPTLIDFSKRQPPASHPTAAHIGICMQEKFAMLKGC